MIILQISLQCPIAEYPYNVHLQNIPAMPQKILILPKISLQCSTTKYPRNAQPQRIPTMPKYKIPLQCPTAEYPYNIHSPNIPAGPNRKYPCNAQPQNIPGIPNNRISIFLQRICNITRKTIEGGKKTLYFLCNNGFRAEIFEIIYFLSSISG